MTDTSSPRIGFLCGSLRKDSINKKLSLALESLAQSKGCETVQIDLGAYDLPLYHGDLDMPEGVGRLISDMKAFDGIVVVSPEYNGGLPPVLKNAIDWTSTVETGHISGPVYGIASCTPGPMSGIMAMRQIQFILMRLGADLVPKQTGCGNAANAFDEDGQLTAQPAASFADTMLDQMIARISTRG